MNYIRIFSFGIGLALVACGDESADSLSDTPTNDSSVTDSLLENTDSVTEHIFFPPPLDVQAVITLPFVYYNCTVVNRSKVNPYCRSDTNGFFGSYTLLNTNSGQKVYSNPRELGTLISFVPNTPENWKQGKNVESFAEITLLSGDIKVWDSVGVGMNETDLLTFIGTNIYEKKENIISAELGEYSSSFTIDADTVSRIVIGKYCQNE